MITKRLPLGNVSPLTRSMVSSIPIRKNDIFISYSRRDKLFIERLDAAFRLVQRDPWIDWEDIYEGEAWRKAITRGIEAADTFIFAISPDSVVSEECHKELGQAIQLNKRIIPIVYRDTTKVPPVLEELNWIFFRESDNFDLAFTKLLKAIDTDLLHVQTHTRLLSRAIEWEHGRDDGFLLRGKNLIAAEQWLIQSQGKEPLPTELQRKYLTKSREVEAANERLAWVGRRAKRILGISVITSGLSLAGAAIAISVATYQANQRIGQLNQQTQQLAANIRAQTNEITNLTTRGEKLAEDRTRLIDELKKFGFTDDKVKTLLVSSPEQWQYQIEQIKQANASYHETVDRIKQVETPEQVLPSTKGEKSQPVPSATTGDKPKPPVTTAPVPVPSPVATPTPTPTASTQTQTVQRSRPIIVSYVAKGINAEVLNPVFKKLGFTAETRSAKGATVTSNVIYYSQDVSVDDVKVIAFALIRAGLQIRAIRPLPPTDTRSAKIEVAAVPDLQTQPPLTVETIRSSSLPLPH